MNEEGIPSSVERLKEEIRKRMPALSINTLPDWALKEFLSYAEKFGGDRGMALTSLIMERNVVGSDAIIALIQDLDERLRKLEGPNSTSVGKEIKLANGRILRRGGKEDG